MASKTNMTNIEDIMTKDLTTVTTIGGVIELIGMLRKKIENLESELQEKIESGDNALRERFDWKITDLRDDLRMPDAFRLSGLYDSD